MDFSYHRNSLQPLAGAFVRLAAGLRRLPSYREGGLLTLRNAVASLGGVLIVAHAGFAQTGPSSVSYSTPDRGGQSIATHGDSFVLTAGYARVQPSSSTTPTGAAIFAVRQNIGVDS